MASSSTTPVSPPALRKWQRFWGRLVAPSASVTDPDARRRARLLSVLLLVLSVSILVGIWARWVVTGELGTEMIISAPVLTAAYGLSRTRHLTLAAALGLVTLAFPSFVIAYQVAPTDPELARTALVWLALPLFFGSFVLGVRGTLLACGLLIAATVGVLAVTPATLRADILMALSLLAVTGGLSVGAAAVHHRDRRAIRRELHRRQEVEQQLRAARDELEVRVSERTVELQEVNDRLGALIASSPAAVVIVDQRGEVGLWNPAAERIFQWPAEEVLGRPPPMELAELPLVEQSPSKPGQVRLQLQTKSGESVIVTGSSAALRGDDESLVGRLAVFLDITEQAHLEEQLRHSQKLEAIGQLAGGIAHDFNNLLMVIQGYSREVLESLDPASPHHADLEQVRGAAARASHLTRQLLAFSRRQVLRPRALDPNEVIFRMGKMLRRLMSEDVALQIELGEEVGLIRADPGQIEQVVINLALNASDAMVARGSLTIGTRNVRRAEAGEVSVAGQLPGRFVELSFVDTGRGMSPEVKERVFEPFFTTKEFGQGTGLGLATVYGIVAQSGGAIEVDSELDQGTTFRVLLPEVEELSEETTGPRSHLPGGTETVLLVEDERPVRQLVAKLLRKLGYTVHAADNGAAAVELAQSLDHPVDLLLTDVVMPEMSGPECARRLRAAYRDLPVVYVSGHADRELNRRGALDAEAVIIHKPFDPEELAMQLRASLDERPAHWIG